MTINIDEKYLGSCCENSFVVFDCRNNPIEKKNKAMLAIDYIAKYKVDSALFLTGLKKNNVAFSIFEKDGSESDSCGNGALLIAFLLGMTKGLIKTKGFIAEVGGDTKKQAISMSLKSTKVKKLDNIKQSVFVRQGEPHVIHLVKNFKDFDLINVGKKMQKKYSGGVNVDMLKKIGKFRYLIKTFERGVFDITRSCGTGSLSSYRALSEMGVITNSNPVEFKSCGGSHWVSGNQDMLKLETLKKFCKISLLK